MNQTKFKVGDRVEISKTPKMWASHLCNNSPMGLTYPIIVTIEKIEEDGNYVAMKAGGYGFSLSNLEDNNNIKLISSSPQTFAPGKNAEQLGIDKSRKFVVVGDDGAKYGPFITGEVVWIEYDDGTNCPCFSSDKHKKRMFRWEFLAYADEQPEPVNEFKEGGIYKANGGYTWGEAIIKVVDIFNTYVNVEVLSTEKDAKSAFNGLWAHTKESLTKSYAPGEHVDHYEFKNPKYFNLDTGWVIGNFSINDGNLIAEPITYNKPEPKRSLTKKLMSFLREIPTKIEKLLSPSLKAQYKAGYINDDLTLTDLGKDALLDVLSEKHEKELGEKAEEIIKKVEKEEKKSK